MNPRETIAVTGATGFVGGALVRRLAAEGRRVRALVRRGSLERFVPGPGTETVVGDLEDEGALERLVAGADAVIHCAARVRGWRAGFEATNVQGTRRLVRAAARVDPPPRFVLISSLAAREPGLSPYAASKRAAEAVLAEEARGMPWTVLRPPAIYGPGDRELLPLLRWVARGVAPVLGPERARFSLLFVEDLVGCIAQLLEPARGLDGVHEVHDGRTGGYGWTDVIESIARFSGRRAVRVRIPAPIAASVAAVNLLAARALGASPMLTPGKVRELSHDDWVCDDAALRELTGWRPEVSLEEGLRRTLSPPVPARADVPEAP